MTSGHDGFSAGKILTSERSPHGIVVKKLGVGGHTKVPAGPGQASAGWDHIVQYPGASCRAAKMCGCKLNSARMFFVLISPRCEMEMPLQTFGYFRLAVYSLILHVFYSLESICCRHQIYEIHCQHSGQQIIR